MTSVVQKWPQKGSVSWECTPQDHPWSCMLRHTRDVWCHLQMSDIMEYKECMMMSFFIAEGGGRACKLSVLAMVKADSFAFTINRTSGRVVYS